MPRQCQQHHVSSHSPEDAPGNPWLVAQAVLSHIGKCQGTFQAESGPQPVPRRDPRLPGSRFPSAGLSVYLSSALPSVAECHQDTRCQVILAAF